MTGTIHVVGAGLSGLAAALDLAESGRRVVIYEATAKAGGRCRSFHDAALDRRIDNGNHLILSGNGAVLAHAARIGAADRLATLEPAFPFADLASGERWTVRVPASPLSALGSDALPLGAGRMEAVAGVAGLVVRGGTVAEAVRGRGPMWRGFWDPMTTAVLNMPPEEGSARLLRRALAQSFFRGAPACRPVIALDGLGAALIEPAVARLRTLGVAIRFRSPLEGIESGAGRATSLGVAGEVVPLGADAAVILAIPPGPFLPGVRTPRPGLAILNAHFVVPASAAVAAPPILGLLGSQAQWLFRRGDVLSVTVSAAERSSVWGMAREAALALLWSDVARALGLGSLQPLASRLLRERNATFDQSPEGERSRPTMRTPLANVVLAGDWTATGLPATLEGAVLSGRAAAQALA